MFGPSKQEKQDLIEQHKVVYQPNHPVWGVKGIPNPTWADIKWWKKFDNEKTLVTIGDITSARKSLWRTAKLLEINENARTEDKVDLNVDNGIAIYETFGYEPYHEDEDLERFLDLYTGQCELQPIKWAYASDFSRLLETEHTELLVKMLSSNILDAKRKGRALKTIERKKQQDLKNAALEERLKAILDDDYENTHPIWSIEGIPQPTKEDMKWFETQLKTKSIVDQHMAFYRAAHAHIWRVAKWMDHRSTLPADKKLDINHLLEFRDANAPIMRAPFTRELSPEAQLIMLKILQTENAKLLLWNTDSHEKQFQKMLQEPGHHVAQYLLEHDILTGEHKKRALMAVGRKRLSNNDAVSSQKEQKDLDDDWCKLSDHRIAHTEVSDDGSSLKRIFDFAAMSVKTIERVPGEHPATFNEKFNDVSDKDINQAAEILKNHGGQFDWVIKKKKSAPIPKSGGADV